MGRKHHFWSSERLVLYGYFLGLIVLGTVLLALPASWGGADGRERAAGMDAFFTAVSAACVTGLITVDTSQWSRVGQCIILLLIQTGGLGIITFGMLYLVLPRTRVSLKSRKIFRESFISEQMPQVKLMVRNIVITTVVIEGMGALLLGWAFSRQGNDSPIFDAVFHAVSAFCNAGFSLFRDGMLPYRSHVAVNLILMVLIVSGGIGFMVIHDVWRMLRRGRRSLRFHTRLMLIATPALILTGIVGYSVLDVNGTFSAMPLGERVMALSFQAVTTRTAGFNTLEQSALSTNSQWLTLMFMLIGGGSGSTAGGIKVSTAFILFLVLFRGVNEHGDVRFLRRSINPSDVGQAAMFFLKVIALLFVGIVALGITERPGISAITPFQILFECVSALGTVGLSMGITGALSAGGKLVVAILMFSGRVALFSLVIRTPRERVDALVQYPRGEVLIG